MSQSRGWQAQALLERWLLPAFRMSVLVAFRVLALLARLQPAQQPLRRLRALQAQVQLAPSRLRALPMWLQRGWLERERLARLRPVQQPLRRSRGWQARGLSAV
jgi:hypothetical protein